MQEPQSEKVDVGTSVHLTFEQFELGNLSFYLPGTPRFAQRRAQGRKLVGKTLCKASHFLVGAGFRFLKPGKEGIALLFTDHLEKLLPYRYFVDEGQAEL